MSCEGVNVLVGAVGLHILQLLSCLRRTDLTIYHSPLLVTLRILRVEVDSLVVVTCSLTTIGAVRGLDITQQEVCRGILILGLACLVSIVSKLDGASGIFLLKVCACNLHQCSSILLVLLVGGLCEISYIWSL